MATTQPLVRETTETTGTGDLTLSAADGARRFSTAYSTGSSNTFRYYIVDTSAGGDSLDWEYGQGYMSGADTLVRDTVIESSNSDNLVDFGAGEKNVVSDIAVTDTVRAIAEASDNIIPSELAVRKAVDTTATGSFVAEGNPGSIQQGGFLLEYVDSDTIRLAKGGKIAMTDFDDGFEMIDVPALVTMDISATGAGGRINNSTRNADYWYGVGIIADSTEANSPALVAWEHDSSANDQTPTEAADLPSGYDLFANLEQPRTGFIRTDGSSNIYEAIWHFNGLTWGKGWMNDKDNLVSDNSPPENSTVEVDASGQIPPMPCDVHITRAYLRVENSYGTLGYSAQDFDSPDRAFFLASEENRTSHNATIGVVKDQNIYYGHATNSDNIGTFIIGKVCILEAK